MAAPASLQVIALHYDAVPPPRGDPARKGDYFER
jgi:hypothetical protein